jgi:hypothetical protein
MTAKLTKNPASFTAWSIERNKKTSSASSRKKSLIGLLLKGGEIDVGKGFGLFD